MPTYRIGFLSATPANAAAYATLNSATRKANIHEVNISLVTAVLSQVELGIPANEATPPVVSTSLTPVGKPSDIAATARVGTAWSTAPTAPTQGGEELILAAVIGSGWVWKWAENEYDELKIAGWRTLWNRGGSAAGQLVVNIKYDE